MRAGLILFTLLLIINLGAQEFDPDSLFEDMDEDSLFGLTEEEAVEEEEVTESPLESLEGEADKFLWGGRIYSDLGSSFVWNDELSDLDGWADDTVWYPQFGLDLYFDARPNPNFRVFAKAKAFYPFDGSIENCFSIHELFTDFNYDNKVYFRIGKQTINWGVGYLFKATDKLNLSPLDPTNRDGDIEGPLALKIQVPLGVNTIYLYGVANEIEHPEDITYAPKVEFLIGNWELGGGGILNPSLTPKGAVFVTGPMGPLDFFAEALFQYGSDLDFFSQVDPPVFENRENQLVFSGTTGVFFRDAEKRFVAIGQYWYDGEAQSADDWSLTGHHFAGLSLQKGFLLQPEKSRSGILNLSLLWLGDFSDGSGMILPEIEWEPIEYAAIALGATLRYGNELSYYRYGGPEYSMAPLEVKLSLRLGYGNY
ncbi:MAG: hypothetical protein JEY91_02280 [Spirochaetaceae bacterium]|nr:hypothetical protein [Spirochaetaceae bacterium]